MSNPKIAFPDQMFLLLSQKPLAREITGPELIELKA
jgi:hypothetical protein